MTYTETTTETPVFNLNMSPTIGKLTEALSKAQGAFDHAKKSVSNEFFKSKYADLAGVIDAAREPLSKNGLAVIQIPKTVDGNVTLITMLSHSSGEWIQGEYPLKPVKADPQGYGSAFTYARRYCYSAITGIAQDDDDGNAASQGKPAKDTGEALLHPSFKNYAERNRLCKELLADISASDDPVFYAHNERLEDVKRCVNGHHETRETFNRAVEARKKELVAMDLSQPTIDYQPPAFLTNK